MCKCRIKSILSKLEQEFLLIKALGFEKKYIIIIIILKQDLVWLNLYHVKIKFYLNSFFIMLLQVYDSVTSHIITLKANLWNKSFSNFIFYFTKHFN